MRRRTAFAGILAAITIGFAVLSYAALADSDSGEDPKAALRQSQTVMASLSFSSTVDCVNCARPHLLEYAPPDRMKLSTSMQRETWPYQLIIGDTGYFSEEGKRWMTGPNAALALIQLYDPRALIDWTTEVTTAPAVELDGQAMEVFSTTLDGDAFIASISSETMDEESQQSLRDAFQGLPVQFLIDSEGRVGQMELGPIEDDTTWVLRFDFDAPVDIPANVESMPYEDARVAGREAEESGARILRAIGRYERANDEYPPSADEGTLGAYLEGPWPENPFTDEPMKQALDTPGDFTYELRNDGNDVSFSVRGWDSVQLFYDSERFGPISLP